MILCDECNKRSKGCITNCMSGLGSMESNIVIVMDTPTPNDDETGIPFSGESAQFLKKRILMPSGANPKSIYYTYAVKCGSKVNKKLTVTEMRNCRNRLFDEIKEVNPKVVIAMGNVALYSLLYLDGVKDKEKDDAAGGMSGIKKWRGKKCWHKELKCYVIPTYSPTFLKLDKDNRGKKLQYNTDLTIEDLELALKVADQERPIMKYPTTEWIKDKKRAIEIFNYFSTLPEYAIDTEAESLEWWVCPLYGISLSGDGQHGYYIDFQILDILDEDIRESIKKMVSSEGWKYLHNSAYDHKLLRKQGFIIKGKLLDTMIYAHLIDENFFKGLKPLTWLNCNFGGYEHELDEYRRANKLTKSFKGLTGTELSPYAGYDAVSTFQLAKILKPLVEEQNMFTLAGSIIIPARKVFSDIEYRGIRVDREKAVLLGGMMSRLEEKIEKYVYDLAGGELNLKSPLQKQNLFFEKLGMKPFKETASSTEEKKCYSTDSESLAFLIKQGKKGGEIAEALQDYSYITKQNSTFVNSIINSARERNGDYFMHTNYRLTGTVTLRASCNNPGLHNIPNDGLVKDLYIPRGGNVILYADVKTAEMRVLSVLAEEEGLKRAFLEGRDVHTEVWRMMFNKGPNDIPTDGERKAIKAVVFGLVYGKGPKALGIEIGVSTQVAKDYIKLFFDSLSNTKNFFENTYKDLKEFGYVTTLFGSRRRLPDFFSDDYGESSKCKRQAVNTLVQTVAGVYTYIGLNRIEAEIKKKKMESVLIHSVHDCVLSDTPFNEIEDGKIIIKNSFEKSIKILPVKMEVDVKVLNSWGDDCKTSRIANVIKKVGLELSNEEKTGFCKWL